MSYWNTFTENLLERISILDRKTKTKVIKIVDHSERRKKSLAATEKSMQEIGKRPEAQFNFFRNFHEKQRMQHSLSFRMNPNIFRRREFF